MTKLRAVWREMHRRCSSPVCNVYAYYGGCGITVAPEWFEWGAFLDWANDHGYEEGLSLERIDNDGPYSPSNCCWATKREQANNRRSTLYISAFGERKSLADWVRDERCAVPWYTLRRRLLRGWQPERAVVEP